MLKINNKNDSDIDIHYQKDYCLAFAVSGRLLGSLLTEDWHDVIVMIKNTPFSVRALLLSFTLLLSACQSAPPAVSQSELSTDLVATSTITSLNDGRTLSPEALLNALSTAEMVIVGEEHSDLRHHQVEQWLLVKLAQKRPQGSVLMEMINNDQQTSVSELQKGMKSSLYIREQRIQELLQWRTGWPWPLYRGVVMTALHGDAPLLAANLSRPQIEALYADPQFPPGAHASDPAVRETLSAVIVAMHGGQMDPEQLKSMLSVQQNRDRFMAQQLMNAPRPALLIAGGYHAAKTLGVPLHLQDLNAPRPQVLILAASGTEVSPEQADYVWYIPASGQ